MNTKHVNPVNPVKTCDFSAIAAIAAFVGLNQAEGKTLNVITDCWPRTIETNCDPATMLFPAGWYFAKRTLRNKHHSSTGLYSEVPVRDGNRQSWTTYAVEEARQCKGEDFSAPVCARVITALNDGAKLVGPNHVLVKKVEPINIVEGWKIVAPCLMGFILKSGNKVVKVFFR